VELNHTFTVPTTVEETWAAFEDIESVAGCFPGATVTEVAGDDFKGSAKVKLGPIALVYTGTGHFVEKDAAARKFVIEAKGKDKRGNGTAGAMVTATLADAGEGSTKVDVLTDLAITGKPAQFGRGVMQDVSDKLLQQFVTCLQDKVGAAGAPAAPAEAAPAEAVPVAAGASEAALASGGDEVGGAGPMTGAAPQPGTAEPSAPPRPAPAAASGTGASYSPPAPSQDDALDLGATVIPVLVKTYGPQAAIALLALVIGYLLGRRKN
jgi:carbon monoxide dehydrogenase subunit G